MKKVFLLVLVLVLSKIGYSQYPVTQQIGADSAIVVSKGATQSRFVNIIYPDTTTANTQRIRQYAGAQIVTNGGGLKLWLRNQNATAWLQIPAGSGVGNIYTTDGTLTGNRVLSGAGFPLTFSGLDKFVVSADSLRFIAGDQALIFVGDTASLSKRISYTSNLSGTFTPYSLVDKNYVDSSNSAGFNGITNYLARFNGANSVDTSQVYQDGQNLGIGTTTPNGRLAIVDTGGFALKINYNSASNVSDSNAAIYAENNNLNSYVAILNEKTTNNTGGQYPILIESSLTTGTAQSGMATGIHFGVPDDAGNKKVTQLALRTTNAAAANYSNRAELRLWNNGVASVPYYLLGNGNMGLGTSTPDSNLTVVNGALFGRGIRASGLPQAPGTKALRIDASGNISYADTLIDAGGTVTSVGLTMPAAFNVGNSPITTAGTISVTAAGLVSQYIRGDGTLADFPGGGGGGGASISYYLNGSVNQGTFGGNTYYEMNKTPIFGAGTDFSINADGYIAQFITDAGDPGLLKIPGGNWSFELFFNASSGGGNPTYYVELYKYDGTTFTLIASGSSNPDVITGGTSVEAYFSTLPVPETVLLATDRLAVRIYVTHAGRTITLHTEDNNLCQIITTFTTGITALNGLTEQVQYFTTGTSGTDFNISSSVATHTFNLPTASATNRGALSTADWTTFNNKVGGSGTANYVTKWTGTNTTGNSSIQDDGTNVSVNANFILNGLLDEPIVSFRSSTGATTYGNIKGTSTGLEFIANGSRNLIFTSNGSERMRVTSGGDVGIGTSSPAYKLDVSGNGRFSSDIVVNSVNVGKGAGSGINNVAIGSNPLSSNTTGSYNIAIGIDALAGVTSAARNIGIGENAGKYLVSSAHNIVIGNNELNGLTTGSFNTIIGSQINSLSNISNHIILADGSGNQRIVVDAAGDVGIGTSTPDSALTVVNGALFQRGVRMSGLPTAAGTRALRINANGTLSVSDTLANGISGTGTTNYIPKFTSSSAIGNSVIYESGGSIGIGTATINGTGTILAVYNATDAQLRLQSANTGQLSSDGVLLSLASDNSMYVWNYEAQPMIFGTSATERMRLDASGNLGLGTSSPSFKLDVNGQIRTAVADGSAQLKLERTNSSTGSMYLGADNIGFKVFDGSFNTRLTLTSDGNLGLGVTPSAWSSSWKAFEFAAAAMAWTGGGANDFSFSTNSFFDATDSRWEYKSTGDGAARYSMTALTSEHRWFTAPIGTAGNAISFTQAMTLFSTGNLAVGGTSDGGYRLNVQQSFASTNSLEYVSQFSRATSGTAANGIGGRFHLTAQDNAGGQRTAAMINWKLTNVSSAAPEGYLSLGSRGSEEALSILHSGNVGIGTTSPTHKLEVYSDGTSIYANSNQSYTNVRFGNTTATAGYIQYTGDNFAFLTSTTERMRITSGGNVTIGSTTADFKFNVFGGSIGWGTSAYQGVLSDDGSNPVIATYGAKNLVIKTNDLERMRITSGGNVGIGTTNPQEKFVVSNGSTQNMEIGTNYIQSFNRGGTPGYADFDLIGNTLKFSAGGSEQMRITSGGELLINTTSDAGNYKLQVDGYVYQTNNSSEWTLYAMLPSASTNSAATLYNPSAALSSNNPQYFVGQRFNDHGKLSIWRYDGTAHQSTDFSITSAGEVLINTTTDAGDYKLQVNGNGYVSNQLNVGNTNFTGTAGAGYIFTNNYCLVPNNTANSNNRNWSIQSNAQFNGSLDFVTSSANNTFPNDAYRVSFTRDGAIQTNAPSGGTAKPFKIGAAATVTPTSPNRTIEIEIDGVTYYLTAKTTND